MKSKKGDEVENIEEIIDMLEKDERSLDFQQPVDHEALGLIDYPQMITHPMDLSTVRKKLHAGKYHSFSEGIEDIQLIWKNCKTYNIEGSVSVCIKKFRKFINLPILWKK